MLSWILDREGQDPNKPLLFDISGTQDREIASLCYSRKTDEPIWIDNPDVGFDVSFQRTGKALLTRYIGHQIAREATPLSPDRRVQHIDPRLHRGQPDARRCCSITRPSI